VYSVFSSSITRLWSLVLVCLLSVLNRSHVRDDGALRSPSMVSLKPGRPDGAPGLVFRPAGIRTIRRLAHRGLQHCAIAPGLFVAMAEYLRRGRFAFVYKHGVRFRLIRWVVVISQLVKQTLSIVSGLTSSTFARRIDAPFRRLLLTIDILDKPHWFAETSGRFRIAIFRCSSR